MRASSHIEEGLQDHEEEKAERDAREALRRHVENAVITVSDVRGGDLFIVAQQREREPLTTLCVTRNVFGAVGAFNQGVRQRLSLRTILTAYNQNPDESLSEAPDFEIVRVTDGGLPRRLGLEDHKDWLFEPTRDRRVNVVRLGHLPQVCEGCEGRIESGSTAYSLRDAYYHYHCLPQDRD